jgi:hypothetical protein
MNKKPSFGLPATAYYGGFANFLVPSRMEGFDEQTDSGIEALGRWAIYDVARRRPHYLDELMKQAQKVFEAPVNELHDSKTIIRLRLFGWIDTEDRWYERTAIRYYVMLHKMYHVQDKYDPNARVSSRAPLVHCLKWVLAAELGVTHSAKQRQWRRYCKAKGIPWASRGLKLGPREPALLAPGA